MLGCNVVADTNARFLSISIISETFVASENLHRYLPGYLQDIQKKNVTKRCHDVRMFFALISYRNTLIHNLRQMVGFNISTMQCHRCFTMIQILSITATFETYFYIRIRLKNCILKLQYYEFI